MPSIDVRAIKNMLLGIEITVIGGVALLLGVLADLGILSVGGLLTVAFGFWVTVLAFGKDSDPRRLSSEKDSAPSDND